MPQPPGMGNKPGASPKPRALKILHGTPITNPQEPVPPKRRITVPKFLTEPGRAIWDDLAPDMIRIGLITPWDAPLFGEFCEALVILRVSRIQAMREVAGQTKPTSVSNSAMNTWLKAMSVVMTMSSRFGMTPADRTRLVANSMAGIGNAPSTISDLLSG